MQIVIFVHIRICIYFDYESAITKFPAYYYKFKRAVLLIISKYCRALNYTSRGMWFATSCRISVLMHQQPQLL
jgi:hypothetical protein